MSESAGRTSLGQGRIRVDATSGGILQRSREGHRRGPIQHRGAQRARRGTSDSTLTATQILVDGIEGWRMYEPASRVHTAAFRALDKWFWV